MTPRSRRAKRASLGVLAVTTVALGTGILSAVPASAASRNGTCSSGEFCYYYNSNEKGSVSDFTGSLGDYGTKQPSCYEFKGSGNGKGRCIKNDAASVWNRSNKTVRVYYNSNYGGAHQDFKPGAKGNLNSTIKNNNASHQFLSSGAGGSCHTDGTNSTPPSTILVYREGTGRVERVGFKAYVKDVLPNEWRSSWDADSLNAGAMAVKSYGWYWALHSTRKTSGGTCYDVKDSTGDQVYRPGSNVASTNAAVNRTWGTRMTRGGSILQAHYCKNSTACGAWVSGDWMSQEGSSTLANRGRDTAPSSGTTTPASR